VLPACVLTVLLVLPLIVFAETKEMRLVSVSQFIQHPALDALLRGFKDYFESENIPVKYRVHIAHGDQGATKKSANVSLKKTPTWSSPLVHHRHRPATGPCGTLPFYSQP